jgi:hypothetical protein
MLRPTPPPGRIIKDAASHLFFLNQFGPGRHQDGGQNACMSGTYKERGKLLLRLANMINDETEQELLRRAITREIGRALRHMFEIEHKVLPDSIRQLLEQLEGPEKVDNT